VKGLTHLYRAACMLLREDLRYNVVGNEFLFMQQSKNPLSKGLIKSSDINLSLSHPPLFSGSRCWILCFFSRSLLHVYSPWPSGVACYSYAWRWRSGLKVSLAVSSSGDAL
jgi:hypothetical protein